MRVHDKSTVTLSTPPVALSFLFLFSSSSSQRGRDVLLADGFSPPPHQASPMDIWSSRSSPVRPRRTRLLPFSYSFLITTPGDSKISEEKLLMANDKGRSSSMAALDSCRHSGGAVPPLFSYPSSTYSPTFSVSYIGHHGLRLGAPIRCFPPPSVAGNAASG